MVSEAAVFSRRAFLQAFLPSLVIAPALAEELIWQPSKTIVLPPVGGWVAGNQLLTVSMVTNEALRILENELMMAEFLNRIIRPSAIALANRFDHEFLRSSQYAWQS